MGRNERERERGSLPLSLNVRSVCVCSVRAYREKRRRIPFSKPHTTQNYKSALNSNFSYGRTGRGIMDQFLKILLPRTLVADGPDLPTRFGPRRSPLQGSHS